MLATNEGVPLLLLWCSGAVVMYAMVLWSNQKRRVVAPCKGRRLQIPVGKGPTDWPRTFDPPIIPHHIHGKRLPQDMRLPHKVGSNVERV